MFFQLYHKLSEKGTLMTQNLCLKETNFTSDIKLPLLQEKKKKCTMLEGTQVVSGDRNSDKQSQLKATGRTWTLLGQYYCLQSSVILSSKKKKKKATRFSEVPWKSSNN